MIRRIISMIFKSAKSVVNVESVQGEQGWYKTAHLIGTENI